MTPKDEVEFACKFLGAEIRKTPYDNDRYFRIYYEGRQNDCHKSAIDGKWHVQTSTPSSALCWASDKLVTALTGIGLSGR